MRNFLEIYKVILYWLLFGVIVVLGRRLVLYGFSKDIFGGDYKIDFLIGTGIAILIGVYDHIKGKVDISE